ncbi:MAG: hypothetical protein ACE5GS_03890 [Kiloniellaceae bacterium]
MATAGPKAYLVALIALLATASEAQAEAEKVVHLDPLEWETSVDFDGTWRRTGTQSTSNREVETGVRLRQSGFGLDPRIFRFAVEVEPKVSRGDFSGADQDEVRDGLFLNYNINANVLQGTPGPVSFDVQAGRTNDTTEGSLGNRSEFDLGTRSLGVNWKTTIFPSTLRYSERSLEQTFRSGLTGATFERDDVLRTVSLRGRSSKLDLSLDRDWLDDQVEGRDFDYTSNRARAGHRFRWGKGSQLTSRVDYFDRNGFNSFENLSLDETADIQHTADLRSTTSYRFTSFTQQTTTTENAGAFSLTHDLYDNLTTTGHASGSFRDSDVLDELEYETGLNLNYRKQIFWGGRFNAGAGAAYRITDRRSQGGFQEVVDESHVVPATGIVILDRRFVDPSSIVITDATGTLVLTQGADFTVSPAAEDLTEIFVLPGGQVAPAETILASYSFEVLPSLKFSTVPYHYRASVDFGWITVFHRASQSNESLISGTGESVLVDREDSTTGVQLRWDRASTRATFSAEKRFQSTGAFETDALDFDQSLIYTMSRGTTLNLSLSEVFSESTNRTTDLYTADLSLRWLPWSNFSLRPHVGFWLRDDEGATVTEGTRREHFVVGGLDLRWFWRKLELGVRYEHNRRGGDITESSEHRVMVTLIRRSL